MNDLLMNDLLMNQEDEWIHVYAKCGRKNHIQNYTVWVVIISYEMEVQPLGGGGVKKTISAKLQATKFPFCINN